MQRHRQHGRDDVPEADEDARLDALELIQSPHVYARAFSRRVIRGVGYETARTTYTIHRRPAPVHKRQGLAVTAGVEYPPPVPGVKALILIVVRRKVNLQTPQLEKVAVLEH